MNYPDELLLNIFQYTTNRTKFRLAQVSHQFKILSYLLIDFTCDVTFNKVLINDNIELYYKFENKIYEEYLENFNYILSTNIFPRRILFHIIPCLNFYLLQHLFLHQNFYNFKIKILKYKELAILYIQNILIFEKTKCNELFSTEVYNRYPETLDVLIDAKIRMKI